MLLIFLVVDGKLVLDGQHLVKCFNIRISESDPCISCVISEDCVIIGYTDGSLIQLILQTGSVIGPYLPLNLPLIKKVWKSLTTTENSLDNLVDIQIFQNKADLQSSLVIAIGRDAILRFWRLGNYRCFFSHSCIVEQEYSLSGASSNHRLQIIPKGRNHFLLFVFLDSALGISGKFDIYSIELDKTGFRVEVCELIHSIVQPVFSSISETGLGSFEDDVLIMNDFKVVREGSRCTIWVSWEQHPVQYINVQLGKNVTNGEWTEVMPLDLCGCTTDRGDFINSLSINSTDLCSRIATEYTGIDSQEDISSMEDLYNLVHQKMQQDPHILNPHAFERYQAQIALEWKQLSKMSKNAFSKYISGIVGLHVVESPSGKQIVIGCSEGGIVYLRLLSDIETIFMYIEGKSDFFTYDFSMFIIYLFIV